MKNATNPLVKFTAIAFAILFILSSVTALFLYNLEKNIFNAEIYKDALQEEGVYDRLPAVIGDQLVSTMASNPEANENANVLAPLLGNLTSKDWEILITALIPPKELEKMGEEAIDETFSFLNGNTETAKISFLSFKNRLVGEEGVNAVVALLKAQPPCTATDLLQLALSGESKMVFCNPPEISMPLLRPLIAFQLNAAASIIPNEKIFLHKTNMEDGFAGVQSTRILMRLSPLIPMTLLFLIIMLIVRDLLTWLRWWGIPILIAGIIAMFLSLIAAPVLQALLSRIFIENLSIDISANITQLLNDLFTTITRLLMENITPYALIITVFGAVMIIGSAFIKKTENSTEII